MERARFARPPALFPPGFSTQIPGSARMHRPLSPPGRALSVASSGTSRWKCSP